MKTKYQTVGNLRVSEKLLNFINNELLKGTDISIEKFWLGFDESVHHLASINSELIKKRKTLQIKIDDWHIKNKSKEFKLEEYKNFLKEIGYIQEEGPDSPVQRPGLHAQGSDQYFRRTQILRAGPAEQGDGLNLGADPAGYGIGDVDS